MRLENQLLLLPPVSLSSLSTGTCFSRVAANQVCREMVHAETLNIGIVLSCLTVVMTGDIAFETPAGQ